jgi:hypothetical protein
LVVFVVITELGPVVVVVVVVCVNDVVVMEEEEEEEVARWPGLVGLFASSIVEVATSSVNPLRHV